MTINGKQSLFQPEAHLLAAIFGEFQDLDWLDKPTVADILEDVPLNLAVQSAGETLTLREWGVLQQRFGLTGQPSKTGEVVARQYGVSRERIRQIEAKALRKLRHPMRSRPLKRYLLPITELDKRTVLARLELSSLLEPIVGLKLAPDLAKRTHRRHLTPAIKSARAVDLQTLNTAIYQSCRIFTTISPCLLCDDPAIPPWDWCIAHIEYRKRKATVVIVCDGCGEKFIRRQHHLIRNKSAHLFCTKDCMWANGKRLGIWANINVGRGGARKTHCQYGHPFEDGRRGGCRLCQQRRDKKRYAARRQIILEGGKP